MSIKQWKSDFYRSLIGSPLQSSLTTLMPLLEAWNGKLAHGDGAKWEKQLDALPAPESTSIHIDETITIERETPLSDGEKNRLTEVLRQYMPWRKGPFDIMGVYIDTEWRSDWKWQRIAPHLPSLKNHNVLDVGCGSGYHLFRMHEAGASRVVGIDPTTLFFYQFHCIKRYASELNIHYLPLGIEDLPRSEGFDTVFSMGVLYHRPDPLMFLKQLRAQLVRKGTLVLETLVVEGDEQTVFMPRKRYAQMRNVYFLPSIAALKLWLEKVGFTDIILADDTLTTTDEQRATEWMTNHSLANFLDPNDKTKTVEEHAAPRRATIIARNK